MEHSIVIVSKDEMLNSLEVVNKLNEGWDILRVDSSQELIVYIFDRPKQETKVVNTVERGVQSKGSIVMEKDED